MVSKHIFRYKIIHRVAIDTPYKTRPSKIAILIVIPLDVRRHLLDVWSSMFCPVNVPLLSNVSMCSVRWVIATGLGDRRNGDRQKYTVCVRQQSRHSIGGSWTPERHIFENTKWQPTWERRKEHNAQKFSSPPRQYSLYVGTLSCLFYIFLSFYVYTHSKRMQSPSTLRWAIRERHPIHIRTHTPTFSLFDSTATFV